MPKEPPSTGGVRKVYIICWESSVSRDESDGKGGGKRLGRGSVRVGDIGELEHGRMVSEE